MGSNNNFGYYFAPSPASFPVASPHWSEWSLQQQQYNEEQYNEAFSRPPPKFSPSPSIIQQINNHSTTTPPPPPPPPPPRSTHTQSPYYSHPNNKFYPPRRFVNVSIPPPPLPSQVSNIYSSAPTAYPRPWQHPNRKRTRQFEGDDMRTKITKKKKKPLSQSMPSKKDWTIIDAERALNIEKDYNKRFKNHSLIIKFPDLELNREIVSEFHPSIETVHFQQPSTPRFCFVTLKDNVDAETVIKALNTIKFGDGYLMAEYKKDREEDQNVGPEDVDPLTLYVGNLGQEVTKDDMVNAFPKSRRIDIGYAKKMKFTRYAFVSFKLIEDSIDAFKQTHNTQMFNKSLIVRFRRLHGTVGMPGESKINNPSKQKENTGEEISSGSAEKQGVDRSNDTGSEAHIHLDDDYCRHRSDEDSDTEREEKPKIKKERSKFLYEAIENSWGHHKPINSVKNEIKSEIKTESEDGGYENDVKVFPSGLYRNSLCPITVKEEPEDNDGENGNYCGSSNVNDNVSNSTNNYSNRNHNGNNDDDDDEDEDDDYESAFPGFDYGDMLNNVIDHSNKISSLRKSLQ